MVTGVNAPASYLLMLQVSCEVTIRLDHVHKSVAKIASALKIDAGYTEISPGITFVAEELIGYAEDFSGKVPAELSNFDFGVQNTGIQSPMQPPALLKISGLVDWSLDASTVTNPTTVTGDTCYSNNSQYLFLHLTSASTLTAVVGAGQCLAGT